MAFIPSTISDLIRKLPSALAGLSHSEIAARASIPAHWELALAARKREPEIFHNMTAIYFITPSGQDFCKVGVSGNLQARLSGLQTGNWAELELRGVIWHATKGAADAHEKAFHIAAKKRGHAVRGEWVAMEATAAMILAFECSETDRFTDSAGLLLDWVPAIIQQEEGLEQLSTAAFRRQVVEKRGRGRPRGEGFREPNGRLSRTYRQTA